METKKTLKSSFVKCAGCGSGLIFAPQEQALKCEQCGLVQPFDKNKEYAKHNVSDKPSSFDGYKKWISENKVLKCQTCGAEIILNNLEYSGVCPYCGSSYVSESEQLPSFVPDAVIPFAFDEKGAGERFVAGVRRKFFVPSAFKKQVPTDKIKGIYIPTFSFDAKTVTQYDGVLGRTVSGGIAPNGVRIMRTETFPIGGIKKLDINDLLIETSSQISQPQMQKILPYNMSEAYKFDENFIRGYVVEHFETAFEECYKQSLESMKQRIRNEILNGYYYNTVVSFQMQPNFNDEKFAYRLVPLYQFEYTYKKQPYRTQMNGQTGKIGGGLPISGWRVFLVVLMVLGFLAGVTLLSLLTQ